jgi:hypothetical protein
MRRGLNVIIVLALVVVLLKATQPAQAYGNPISYTLTCSSLTITGKTNQSYLGVSVYIPSTGYYFFNGYPVNSNGEATVTINFPAQPLGTTIGISAYGADSGGYWDYESYVYVELVCPSSSASPAQLQVCPFTDGRLNKCDAGQSVAVYCKPDGTVEALAIYKGEGLPGIIATPAEIAAIPTHPAKNTLIKQSNGVRLYRLTSGLLQINRADEHGKDYIYRFTCGS